MVQSGTISTMFLLAIDTATNSGGVAISRNHEVIGLTMMKTPLKYAEHVIYYIEFLLTHLGVKMEEINCVAVSSGPGSFTGLRIGIAMTKGLAQPLDLPAVGISTLEALAYRFRHVSEVVAPMIDARRQQIYGGVYKVADEQIETISKGTVLAPAKWMKEIPGDDCLFVGDGAQMYRQAVIAARPKARVILTDNAILTELCQLGYRRYLKGEAVSAIELKANYIRPSDAEKKGTEF